MKDVRTMTGVDFVKTYLLGEEISADGLIINGDVVIEGFGENQKFLLENLNLSEYL
jgi:carbamate kinase